MGDRESEEAGVSGGKGDEDEPIPASLSDQVVSYGEGDGGEVGDFESDFGDEEKGGPGADEVVADMTAFNEHFEARLGVFQAETEMEVKLHVEVDALGAERDRQRLEAAGAGEMGLLAGLDEEVGGSDEDMKPGGSDAQKEVGKSDAQKEVGESEGQKGGEKKNGKKGEPERAAIKESARADGEEVTEDGEIVSVGGVIGVVGELGETIRTYKEDFERWAVVQRRRRAWWWIGGLLVAVVGFGSGVGVEREFEIVPFKDSTGGWRDHVWARGYGPQIADCVIDARKRKVEELECVVMVSPP